MCGTDYCGTCTPTQAITDFAEGRSHETPTFGDRAQRWVAHHRRHDLFRSLVSARDPKAAEFPEFGLRQRINAHISDFAKRGALLFGQLRTSVSAFAAFVDQHPFQFPAGKSTKKRAKAFKLWQRHTIVNYVRSNDDSALRELEAMLGYRVPWWWPQPKASAPDMAEMPGVAHLLTEPTTAPERELEPV